MRRYEHTHRVNASPAEVWAVLCDLAGWPRWNSIHGRAPEGLSAGAPLRLTLFVAGRSVPARAAICRYEPERALIWQGGVPGVFQAVHGFELQPDGDGCRVTHHESFTGLLVPLGLALLGSEQDAMYGRVNAALARVVEDG